MMIRDRLNKINFSARVIKWQQDNTSPTYFESCRAENKFVIDAMTKVGMTALQFLYPMIVHNGLVILDDYPYWAGCTRVVHKYLSDISSESRVHEVNNVTHTLRWDKTIVSGHV